VRRKTLPFDREQGLGVVARTLYFTSSCGCWGHDCNAI